MIMNELMPIHEGSTEALAAEPGDVLHAMGRAWVKRADGLLERASVRRSLLEDVEDEHRLGMAAGLRQFWDAAFPPGSPPNTEGVAFYVGGGTPHVWTPGELDASLIKSTAQFRIPIYVRVPPTSHDPKIDARFCVDWCRANGQPRGTLFALDYETAISDWQVEFDQVMFAAGWPVVLYGTRRTVLQNKKPSGGFWTATWSNVAHLDAGAVATQYGGDVTLGQPWDINVIADSASLWGGVTMPSLDDVDLNGVESRLKKVLNVSGQMTIVQNGQIDNTKALTVLADRLIALKVQIAALASLVQGEADQTQAALAGLLTEEDQTQAAITLLSQGEGNPAAIAAAVIAGVGPAIAVQVADELHRRTES
jgi:hypothetical protein